jgi:hypothetical protein
LSVIKESLTMSAVCKNLNQVKVNKSKKLNGVSSVYNLRKSGNFPGKVKAFR